MGNRIASIFRLKEVDFEVALERLEREINGLEERIVAQRRLFHRVTRSVVLYSIVVFILVLIYRAITKPVDSPLGLRVAPAFAVFIVTYILHRLVSWGFNRSIGHKEDYLERLRERQEEKLEELLEKRDFHRTQRLVQRYAREPTPGVTPGRGGGDKSVAGGPDALLQTPGGVDGGGGHAGNPNTPWTSGGQVDGFTTPQGYVAVDPTKMVSVPPKRSALDKVVQFLVNDGPNNRYALICRMCHTHNGLALQEDLEKLKYSCPHCHFLNDHSLTAEDNVDKEKQRLLSKEAEGNRTKDEARARDESPSLVKQKGESGKLKDSKAKKDD